MAAPLKGEMARVSETEGFFVGSPERGAGSALAETEGFGFSSKSLR